MFVLFWLSLAQIPAAVVDVESFQACARITCREGNPLLPDSRIGQYAVKAAMVVPLVIWYEKTDSRYAKWALVSTLVAGAAAGIINLRF